MIATAEPEQVVVDASVALKWFLVEPGVDEAVALLRAGEAGTMRLHAPDHWLAEVANVLWLRSRPRPGSELMAEDAAAHVRSLAHGPVLRRRVDGVLAQAFTIAHEAGVTVYDALYVATAERLEARLITADLRLVERLASSRWSGVAVPLV